MVKKTIDLGEYVIKIAYNSKTGDLDVSVLDELNELIESINITNDDDDEDYEEGENSEDNIGFNLN